MNATKNFFIVKYIIIIIITSFISLTSTIVLVEASSENNQFSTIADQVITSVSSSGIKKELTQVEKRWRETPLEFACEGEEISIPHRFITFDFDETVKQFKQGRKKSVFQFWKSRPHTHVPLTVVIKEEEMMHYLNQCGAIDKRKTVEEIHQRVANELETHFKPIYKKEIVKEEELLSSVRYKLPSSRTNIDAFIQQIHQMIIQPKETFSFLDRIENKENLNERLYSSILYSLFLETNYVIVERHPYFEQLEPFELGREAIVDRKVGKNLKIYNPNDVPGKIEARYENETLVLSLYSLPIQYEVELIEGKKEALPSETVVVPSADLSLFDKYYTSTDGSVHELYRQYKDRSGNYIESEYVSTNIQLSTPRYIEEKQQEDLLEESLESVSKDEGIWPSEIKNIESDPVTNQYDDVLFEEGGKKYLDEELEYDKGGYIISE